MTTFRYRRTVLVLAGMFCSAPVLAADTAAIPAAVPAAQAPAPALPPLKVLMLPPDIKIYTISVGNMEEAPDATAKMTTETDAELRRALSSSQSFRLVTMPALSPDEQTTLKEHIALYKLVAQNAEKIDEIGGAWKPVLENFDYSLGPGLRFLKQKSGADYALIVFGGDGESTGGNMVATFLIGGRTGRNFLFAGLVDLDTGNIVWLHHDTHDASDFTAKNNMDVYVDDLLNEYPDGSLHDFGAQP